MAGRTHCAQQHKNQDLAQTCRRLPLRNGNWREQYDATEGAENLCVPGKRVKSTLLVYPQK